MTSRKRVVLSLCPIWEFNPWGNGYRERPSRYTGIHIDCHRGLGQGFHRDYLSRGSFAFGSACLHFVVASLPIRFGHLGS